MPSEYTGSSQSKKEISAYEKITIVLFGVCHECNPGRGGFCPISF